MEEMMRMMNPKRKRQKRKGFIETITWKMMNPKRKRRNVTNPTFKG